MSDLAPVPLADEVRAARAAVRRAERAATDLAQIEVALALVQRGLPVDEGWADGFADRWPELGAVRPTDRALLLALRGALAPIARGLAAAANRLHHLQHEQRAALAAPGREALRAELDARLAELDALAHRRTVPTQRVAALGPALEVVARAADEVDRAAPERASTLAGALAGSLAPVLEALEIELPAADPAHPADPRAAVRGMERALADLLARARAEAEEADAAWGALNQHLLERMG